MITDEEHYRWKLIKKRCLRMGYNPEEESLRMLIKHLDWKKRPAHMPFWKVPAYTYTYSTSTSASGTSGTTWHIVAGGATAVSNVWQLSTTASATTW